MSDIEGAAMPKPIYDVKAQFFKTLGHPARIRILEILAGGPRSVSELQPDVGLESSHLSQQLAVLRKAGVVRAKRQGSSMIYSVADPQVFELLSVAKKIIVTSLSGADDLLAALDSMSYGPFTEENAAG
ncbi:MAG: metalloregulator ArsR/SmtB family transcription factor [Acidimicrobiales bacterium]